MNDVQQQRRYWIILSGLSLSAGWALAWIGMPAAWFLGPMVVAGVLACLRPTTVRLPESIYLAGQAIIGGAVSTALTPATLALFGDYWLPITLTIGTLLGVSLLNGVWLARHANLDLATALLGMLPGGAPGMIALSDALGADSRLVAIMQTLRVMLVLGSLAVVTAIVLPVGISAAAHGGVTPVATHSLGAYALTLGLTVVGAWAGMRLHLPAGPLVGPALLGALLSVLGFAHAPWPPLLLDIAYAVVGISVGVQFNLQTIRTAGRLLPAFLFSTMVLIGGAALLAWGLTLFTSIDLFSAYLATMPGGLNMVTIVALESGSNVTLILTINLLRFLVIVLAGAPLVRWFVARQRPRAELPPEDTDCVEQALP